MRKRALTLTALALIVAGMTGCSRTVEDVAKWEAKGNIEKLSDALTDPKVEVRVAAVESLGLLKDKTTIEAISACFNDADDSVVLAAVDALAAIGGDNIFTPMIAALKLPHEEARLKAADTLGVLKNPGAAAPLSEALNDSSEKVQLAAAKALALIGDESGSPALAKRLADDSAPEKMRIACAEALAKTGGAPAYDALLHTLADQNERVMEAAKMSLIRIGDPVIPSAIDALKHENIQIRKEAIALLRGLSAIPTTGRDVAWYQLARATIDHTEQSDSEMISILTGKGSTVVEPLLEACTLTTPDIRGKASLVLGHMPEACLAKATQMVPTVGSNQANIWFGERTSWSGAPSQLLDVWGALAALNPHFELDDEIRSALQEKGRSALRVLTGAGFEAKRAYIPYIIPLLDDEDCAETAKKVLQAAGNQALLPLIGATGSDNDTIANRAAELIMDRKDPRALQPLMRALQTRIDTGAILSESPLYTALQKLNDVDAEPLILKIRPNTERALHLFTMQYRDARVIGAETSDPYTDTEAPITFRIGYIQDGQPGTLEITFKKDSQENWNPSPALPYRLPQEDKVAQ